MESTTTKQQQQQPLGAVPSSSVQPLVYAVLFITIVLTVSYLSYTSGALDPIIGRITVYMFKAKAAAAAASPQKLGEQGLKAGQGLMSMEVPGSQQAKQTGAGLAGGVQDGATGLVGGVHDGTTGLLGGAQEGATGLLGGGGGIGGGGGAAARKQQPL